MNSKGNIDSPAAVAGGDARPRNEGDVANVGVITEEGTDNQDREGYRDFDSQNELKRCSHRDCGSQGRPDPARRVVELGSGEEQRVWGVSGRLDDAAGGIVVLACVIADDAEQAIGRVLRKRRYLNCARARFLGLKGTDDLSESEDAWAMEFLETTLFARCGGDVAIAPFDSTNEDS